MNKIAAIIPAYNESSTIESVVKKVKLYAFPIVVDDGSQDDTNYLARKGGAEVITHNQNKGYDAALQTGIFTAIKMGYKYAVTIDADAQHSPEKIKEFEKYLIKGYDIVLGQRDRYQRISEIIFSIISKILWKVNDPLCGMKGYKLSNIEQLGYFDTYSSIGTEYMIYCIKNRMKIKCIPLEIKKRKGKSRFGGSIEANRRIIRAMIKGVMKYKNK
jgi:glycosyltransferase involved in cell wall biosynthesis